MENSQIAKQCGENWHKLTDEEKKPYKNKFEQDCIRYKKEMDEFTEKGYFINSDGINSNTLKAKKKIKKLVHVPIQNQQKEIYDEVVKPKKQTREYMWYSMETYKVLKEQNPNLENWKIAKLCGENWHKLADEQKEPYKKKFEQDCIRYKKEMEEFAEKGYFINSDGINSNTLKAKKKIKKSQKIREKIEGSPKQAKCAYMYFVKDYHSNNKNAGNVIGCIKVIGEKWKNHSEEEKSKYVAMAEKDKERYKREKFEFDQLSYFINEDGKSTYVDQK